MQPLELPGIADVGPATPKVPGVPGIHQQHLEPALVKDLESRDAVDAGGLHDHRL